MSALRDSGLLTGDHGGFCHELRSEAAPLWDAVHHHPFVRGIGDGSLSDERFLHYLRQDYIYLLEFSRLFALAAAKAPSLEDQRHFAELTAATLEQEMELHRRVCGGFGITESELEEVEPALVTKGYADALLRAAYEGGWGDLLAVLLPCDVGYAEIAQRLAETRVQRPAHLQDWVDTYASAEYRAYARWVVDRLDRHAAGASRAQRERWRRRYRASTRWELLFFEMGWQRQGWPAPVPEQDLATGGDHDRT